MPLFRCLWLLFPLASYASSLQTGDLLFVRLDCGPTCTAIEEVTLRQFGRQEPRLSHMGLIERSETGKIWVWEAWPGPGVHRVSLEAFLSRPLFPEDTRHLPLPDALKVYGPALLNELKKREGKKYNSVFLWNSGEYYCSQLVYEAWKDAAPDINLFQDALLPMDYGAPLSSERLLWKDYFDRRLTDIPAGQPGVSPLGIYLSAKTFFANFESEASSKE